jgi:hypothetical protein
LHDDRDEVTVVELEPLYPEFHGILVLEARRVGRCHLLCHLTIVTQSGFGWFGADTPEERREH